MTAKLSLGPVLFNWDAKVKRDFYFHIADEAPFDTVYLGEVVCSKRTPFFEPFLPEVIERLRRGGKEVVLSTLALIMSERELDSVRALAGNGELTIEANDMAAVSLLAGSDHVIGPFVNVYNEGSLEFLENQGARRVSLPWELPSRSLSALASFATRELEVQAFGRAPLAISARCYHARSHGLHKDGCQFVCIQDPDGMEVQTLDGKSFLSVNGPQTLSHSVFNLISELEEMRAMGIDAFRLWPHMIDMARVAEVFRDVLDGAETADEGQRRLDGLVDFAPFSNGFYYGQEGAALVS